MTLLYSGTVTVRERRPAKEGSWWLFLSTKENQQPLAIWNGTIWPPNGVVRAEYPEAAAEHWESGGEGRGYRSLRYNLWYVKGGINLHTKRLVSDQTVENESGAVA